MTVLLPPRIATPGVYDIPFEEYLADPCVEPSLSASIAHLMVDRSPLHAKLAHPRLSPQVEERRAKHLDDGSIAHALLLEGDRSRVVIVNSDSYRTKASQEARDAAYADRKLPVLAHRMEAIEAMVAAARMQIAANEQLAPVFARGLPERTLVWEEDGVWFRIRPDWTPAGGSVFPDVKISGGSAHPDQVARRGTDLGYEIRAALYQRGIRKVLGIENPLYVLVTIEDEPPYALTHCAYDPDTMQAAELRLDMAIERWRWCLKANRWPAYRRDLQWISAPVWTRRVWEADQARREIDHEQKLALNQVYLEWLAPPSDGAATEAA